MLIFSVTLFASQTVHWSIEKVRGIGGKNNEGACVNFENEKSICTLLGVNNLNLFSTTV